MTFDIFYFIFLVHLLYLLFFHSSLDDQVPWTDEQMCLDGICRAIAEFYGTLPTQLNNSRPGGTALNSRAEQCDKTLSQTDAISKPRSGLMETPTCPTAAPPVICELFEFVFHPSIAFNKHFRVPAR